MAPFLGEGWGTQRGAFPSPAPAHTQTLLLSSGVNFGVPSQLQDNDLPGRNDRNSLLIVEKKLDFYIFPPFFLFLEIWGVKFSLVYTKNTPRGEVIREKGVRDVSSASFPVNILF